MRLLVTGGCGFIGSAVIRHALRHTQHDILNLDSLTYAASEDALENAAANPRYRFVHASVADAAALQRVFAEFAPEAVMHLAAESHVDRSIDAPAVFIETNIVGTFMLLQEATRHWQRLGADAKDRFRFHHISTDEVFGALGADDPPFTETTPYDPRSPYSASKAASDHLVRAWHHTYGLPTIVSNTSNNYGPWQFPEKLIPLIILSALAEKPLPVYGTGENIRDWIFVEDHAEALLRVAETGTPGQTYALGARQPRRNLDVVHAICSIVDDLAPSPCGPRAARLIHFVPDRPGHDFRYEIDPTTTESRLDWKAKHDFATGLRRTVEWYLSHQDWWRNVSSRYAGQRLGTAA